jgi:hypothetical protein
MLDGDRAAIMATVHRAGKRTAKSNGRTAESMQLPEVDGIRITSVVYNFVDLLLRDEGPARRRPRQARVLRALPVRRARPGGAGRVTPRRLISVYSNARVPFDFG